MVFMQNNSLEEKELLKEFKKQMEDFNQDEKTCLRFLRARNHDKIKAGEMLRKSIEWREACELDSFETWTIPKEIILDFPFRHTGVDNTGHPVIYFPVGRWEARKFIEAGWKEDMERYILFALERIMSILRDSKEEQFYCIVDLAELTYYKWAHYETIQMTLKVFKLFESNYPETLNKAVVINAPWIFGYVFPVIKPIMSSHTLSKISVYDGNMIKWRASLMEDIPPSSIPEAHCSN